MADPRDQTDESLRLERDKADSAVADKRNDIDVAADALVQVARDLADEVVQSARDKADRESGSTDDAAAEVERARADAQLAKERSKADAVLDAERRKRRQYVAAFLAAEREATDQDLVDERAKADRLLAAQDEFLGAVSHDLRSLLSGLLLGVEVRLADAPEGPAGDTIRRREGTSKRLLMRMNRLINDLLDVVSIEAGSLAVVPEAVDVIEILEDAFAAFEAIATSKRIKLQAEFGTLPPRLWLDSGRILQVLTNLVSNALKFTPNDGGISIRINLEGAEIHFAVSDTGIGMSDEALLVVFERFRQVSKAGGGLGLGLHISKSIVEAHGGRIWAESQLGVGSTLHFVLPIRAELTIQSSPR